MKFDKKVMESGMVAAFTLALAFSAMPVSNVPANANSDSQTVELTEEPEKDRKEVAAKQKRQSNVVASAAVSKQTKDSQEKAKEKLEQKKQEKSQSQKDQPEKALNADNKNIQDQPEESKIEKEQTKEVQNKKAQLEESQTEETQLEEIQTQESQAKEEQPEKSKEEKKQSEKEQAKEEAKVELAQIENQEVSPWAEKLMPNVEEYLNVRTEASEEAELAGKLHKGAGAEILEQGEEWTKIRSGNVEGYVKNEFCVTGLEAEALANEVGTTYATAITGGVRVRESASSEEDVKILDVLEEEGRIKVDKDAETVDGWVPVKVDDQVGYVSEEYVTVEMELGKAISIEEERAAIAAAEAEQAAKEAAARKSSGQQNSGSQQKAAVSASYDDVTLLGALIQCEAGSESYEGQVAVGAVVMNRLRAGYAGSISGVIYQSGQFSPASSGALASVLSSGVSGSCLSAAQEAINGVDNVNGATSFRRAGAANGIVIGNHVFF